MDEFLLNENVITAGNVAWMAMALPVVVIFVVVLLRSKPWNHANWLMLGVTCVAAAALGHRAYWLIWRELTVSGYAREAATLLHYENALVFLSAITALGYTFHIKTYLRALMGRHWAWYTTAYLSIMVSIPFLT